MNDTTTADLTAAQKILVAAHRLTVAGQTPFTVEALTVAAWKANPGTFGLRGFDYPDNNKVESVIMGQRGLAARGWLNKVGPKTYTLERAGQVEALRVINGDGDRRALPKVEPSPEAETELQRLLASKPVLRLRANAGQTLNRTDAEAFWSGTTAEGIDALVAAARECLVGGAVRLRSGREVSDRELADLGRVNAWLSHRFNREIERAGRVSRV